jgi:hypothetical protein
MLYQVMQNNFLKIIKKVLLIVNTKYNKSNQEEMTFQLLENKLKN